MFYLIPLIIGLVLLILFLYFRVKEKRVLATYLKGLTSLCFIITALVAYLLSKNPNNIFGVFVIIGLCFGLLGDVFLDIKFITKKHEYLMTALGFIAFGVGHIFYISGLFISYFDFSRSVLYIIIPIIISILGVVMSLLMEKFTPIRYNKMLPFVIGYGFILFFVTSMYFSTSIQSSFAHPTLLIISISLVVFTLSDLILNNTYFSKGCNTPIFIISNHVLYYLAQFAIAISLLFIL